jgi:hypothetical protein
VVSAELSSLCLDRYGKKIVVADTVRAACGAAADVRHDRVLRLQSGAVRVLNYRNGAVLKEFHLPEQAAGLARAQTILLVQPVPIELPVRRPSARTLCTAPTAPAEARCLVPRGARGRSYLRAGRERARFGSAAQPCAAQLGRP